MILYSDISQNASLTCATTATNYNISAVVSNNQGEVWRSNTATTLHYIRFTFPAPTTSAGIAIHNHNLVGTDSFLFYGSNDNFVTHSPYFTVPLINSVKVQTLCYREYMLLISKNTSFAQVGKIYLAGSVCSLAEESFNWSYKAGELAEFDEVLTLGGQVDRSLKWAKKQAELPFTDITDSQAEILQAIGKEPYTTFIYNQIPIFGFFRVSLPDHSGPNSANFTMSFEENPK